MDGGIVDVLQFAIDGVSQQTNAVANNLANASTPDFTASDVNFQQSLEQAISAPGTATASVTTTPDSAPPDPNGNNVSYSSELVASEKAALEYQQLSQSLDAQFRIVRGVVGGGWG
jgi:flagellar basal-body rod protein FlgB